MNVAILARVSTTDGRQNTERQLNDLKDLCSKNNWNVAEIITAEISGSKTNAERKDVQQLIDLAKSGSIQKVVITEVSRLGRNLSQGIQLIETLTKSNVSVYIQNIGMETLLSNGKENFMFKPILVTLMGFAEMERELLRERIRSGLETAKKNGKKLGRPKGSRSADYFLKKHKPVIRELDAGLSIRKIAAICNVSTTTVQKVKSLMQQAN